ncbi:MAG: hypothetical protein ACSHW0_04330 [Thalassotalea sp.]
MKIIQPAQKRKGVYKYLIHEDLLFENSHIKKAYKNDWLEIKDNGDIIIKGTHDNGYAWDGCTPKVNCFDLILLGIPDGRKIVNTDKPITYYASLVHDILCQFQQDIGIDRKDADKVFLYYLGDFNLRYFYYAAVRIYGSFLHLIGTA